MGLLILLAIGFGWHQVQVTQACSGPVLSHKPECSGRAYLGNHYSDGIRAVDFGVLRHRVVPLTPDLAAREAELRRQDAFLRGDPP